MMRRLFAVITFLLAHTPLHAANEQDLGPFQALASIPSDVDAAAVFENPAETLLLSPVGRSFRSLLAMGGVFTQTERAWQALGDAFDAPVDETIRALLSKRVAVVWDGFERGDASMHGLTDSIDTRWTLICEVEPDYLKAIQVAMRPVKRDIAFGRAVYAIEQGRYRIALLDSPKPGVGAIVLLAPRSGAPLLDDVLAQMVGQTDPQRKPITDAHQDMLVSLTQAHLAKGDGSWSFAFMTRVSIFTALTGQQLPVAQGGDQDPDHIFAGMVQLETDSMRCSFASSIPVAPGITDAPVDLYEAVADDAVLALACARMPQILIQDDSLQLTLAYSAKGDQHDTSEDAADPTLFQSPGLMVIKPTGSAGPMSMSLMLMGAKRGDDRTALIADQTMQAIIASYDPAQAPRFDGRLPAVTRSLTLHKRSEDAEEPTPNWPGTNPRVAWQTLSEANSSFFIASMTPNDADPARQIAQLEQAALTLHALGPRPDSGTLLRARLRPPELIDMLGQTTLMDLALSKLVRQADIEIRRGLRSGIRGQLNIEFTNARIPGSR